MAESGRVAQRTGTLAKGRPAEGLYDPAFEHDACGVAFVADIAGRRDHRTVSRGLTALINLEHRGARGAEPNTGDGAGILIQVPDGLYRPLLAEAGVELPPAGRYAVGNAFLPADADPADLEVIVAHVAAEEGLEVLAWRELPVDPDGAGIGPTARAVMPRFRQLFVGLPPEVDHVVDTPNAGDDDAGIVLTLERRAFALRKRVEHESRTAGVETYFPSLSGRTVVYKGMLAEEQVEPFFADLADERTTSSIALVHSRFSTNTFPAWSLAHPYRYLAHNGEINTLRGNRNWMAARESMLATGAFGEADLDRLFPIVTPDASDSATFDEVLELLHLGGRSLPHAVLMMIPEAWENHAEMDTARRAFYRYHSTLMEAWDGPALAAFTDGSVIGAVLDRNGLRPARYWVTEDGLVVLGSEVGVLDIDPSTIVRKGRLEPGRMFLVDTVGRRIVDDDEIKGELAAEHPYDEWLHAGMVELADLPSRSARQVRPPRARAPPADLRLHRRGGLAAAAPDGAPSGAEATGLDGQRRAARAVLVAQPRAVRLLHPALRAGHQPAAGRLPRGARHLAAGAPRLGDQPARRLARLVPSRRAADAGDRRRRARAARRHQRRRRPAGLRALPRLRALRRRGRRRRAARPARRDPRGGLRGRRGRRPRDHPVGPPLRRRPRADPVAAAHRRGAPPPRPREDAHARRPRRRGRRRPRDPPRLAAAGLRRERGEPLPRAGHRRRPHRPRRDHRRHLPAPRPATWSRRWPRACAR